MSSTTYKSPGSPSFRETTTTPPGSSGFRESTTPTGFPDFRTSTITPDLPNFRETTTPPGFPDFQTSTTSPGFPNYQNSTPGNNLTSESMSTDSPAGGNSPSQRDSTSISDNEEAEQEADLPLTMAASVILTQLPKDAKTALEGVAAGGVLGGGKGAVADKVTISFHPIASAPRLRGTQNKFRVSSAQPFSTVIRFLRKKIGLHDEKESIFCYVNQCFAPGLDEGVGGLWACFKTGDELVVHYAIHPAFG